MMVQPKEKKPSTTEDSEWLVKINGYKTTVKSATVEDAIAQAFNEYWGLHDRATTFIFNIEVMNRTYYKKAQDWQEQEN